MSFEPPATGWDGSVPLCVPEIRGNECRYVQECLNGNFVSSTGPFVERFERATAAYVGGKYAVATVTGTAALHVALLVSGVGPDDEVLVPALTFIAPANAVRYTGAAPVFIDVEPDYWQMDVQKVRDFLERQCQSRGGALYNRSSGRRVRAILPVHILGHPVDIAPLVELARRYDLVVVEDATESLGARYCGRMVGSLGDVACLSFNGNKLVTAGGGGMIVTDRADWAEKAGYLTTQAKDDPYEYVHGQVGYNYRLTNLQAALGVAQLEQIDEYIDAKRSIAERYAAGLGDCPGLALMRESPKAFSTFWLYTVLVDEREVAGGRRGLAQFLHQRRIQTRPLWQPLHRSPAHRGAQAFAVHVADEVQRRAISLPCSVGLASADQDRVIEALTEVVCAWR